MKYFLVFFNAFLVSFISTALYMHFRPKTVVQPVQIQQIVSAFSLQKAPKQTLNADIISLKGETLWQSRVATEPAKITSTQQLQEGENIFTKKSGTMTFEYKNNETITMQPNTEVDIVQTLPVNIVLSQQGGTAEYVRTGAIPLSVHVLSLLINQETQGDVSITVNTVNDTVLINVKRGTVKAGYTDTTNSSVVDTIQAGQKYLFDDDSASGEIL